ncbi:MAG: nucleotidyltransferase family protein [Hyphomicrobiales bacterium]|nr:nucleotidyltransferase family protein [Hyphomicrobiales bacterium]
MASLTPAEWTDLVELAIRQGVGPQLPPEIAQNVPAPARARLEERVAAAVERVRRYREEFLNLAAAVEPQGVEIVGLKGIHLALGVYPPSVLREMADIDVLVRRNDIEAVEAAAHELGFESRPDSVERRGHHLDPLSKPGASLEIHWQLAEPGEPPTAPPGSLWPDVRPLAGGGNVFGLAPEDALIHVGAHATYSHHLEQGMRPICDIRALITAPSGDGLDWDRVVSRALEWNAGRCVVIGLILARDLLAAKVPPEVIARLGGPPPAAVTSAAMGQVFGQKTETHRISSAAGQLLAGSSPLARLRNVFQRVKLPSEQIAAMYPNWSRGTSLLQAWVMMRRGRVLVKRYGWILMRTAIRPQSPEARHVARRNALRSWISNGDPA